MTKRTIVKTAKAYGSHDGHLHVSVDGRSYYVRHWSDGTIIRIKGPRGKGYSELRVTGERYAQVEAVARFALGAISTQEA